MIGVLVVDDSALARDSVVRALACDDIEILAQANDAFAARDVLQNLNPDVITLDLDMPGMDGLTFLRMLQAHRPVPVVVLSARAHSDPQWATACLQAGASDVLAKPDSPLALAALSAELQRAVRAAARSQQGQGRVPDADDPATPKAQAVVAIQSSSGALPWLLQAIKSWPKHGAPWVIVHPTAAGYEQALLQYLQQQQQHPVALVESTVPLQPGQVWLAPAQQHMVLGGDSAQPELTCVTGPAIQGACPSADVLFTSGARHCASAAVALRLVLGPGDGVQGQREVMRAGGLALAPPLHDWMTDAWQATT
ncbi:MAG: chemotaxis two-component response regulator [Pseudomonadota bacterium]